MLSLLIIGAFAVFGEAISNFVARNKYNQNLFSDIEGNEWYAKNVQRCYELGLKKGKNKS